VPLDRGPRARPLEHRKGVAPEHLKGVVPDRRKAQGPERRVEVVEMQGRLRPKPAPRT